MRIRLVIVAIVLSGCGIFSRPPNTFYSLQTSGGQAIVPVPADAPPIGIDGIELPPGLDRRGVVVREEDGKLDVRGRNQWAGPLEDMVIHTLAFNLARRLPEGMVVLPGQAKPAGAMRSIFIVFEELAPGPEPVFVLDARWTMSGTSHHERITVPMESLDSDDVVAAMSQSLATLSDRIAAGLS